MSAADFGVIQARWAAKKRAAASIAAMGPRPLLMRGLVGVTPTLFLIQRNMVAGGPAWRVTLFDARGVVGDHGSDDFAALIERVVLCDGADPNSACSIQPVNAGVVEEQAGVIVSVAERDDERAYLDWLCAGCHGKAPPRDDNMRDELAWRERHAARPAAAEVE